MVVCRPNEANVGLCEYIVGGVCTQRMALTLQNRVKLLQREDLEEESWEEEKEKKKSWVEKWGGKKRREAARQTVADG